MSRWDHLRTGQTCLIGNRIDAEANQCGDKEEESATPSSKISVDETEDADVGDCLDGWTHALGALLIEPARKSGEALFAEHLANRRGAQGRLRLLQRLADLIDGVIALAEGNDLLAQRGLEQLRSRARLRGHEKGGGRVTTELMTEDAKGARGVSERLSDLGGGPALDEVRP